MGSAAVLACSSSRGSSRGDSPFALARAFPSFVAQARLRSCPGAPRRCLARLAYTTHHAPGRARRSSTSVTTRVPPSPSSSTPCESMKGPSYRRRLPPHHCCLGRTHHLREHCSRYKPTHEYPLRRRDSTNRPTPQQHTRTSPLTLRGLQRPTSPKHASNGVASSCAGCSISSSSSE